MLDKFSFLQDTLTQSGNPQAHLSEKFNYEKWVLFKSLSGKYSLFLWSTLTHKASIRHFKLRK